MPERPPSPPDDDHATCSPVEPTDVARLLPLGGPVLAELWAAEAEEARAACLSGKPRGPVTGFAEIDRELGGYLTPGLHVVHGEPGTGKTNYALQVAAQCRVPALFVSCEMSPIVLLRRLVARTTGTFLGKLDDGEKSPAELLQLFARTVDACPMLALMDATRARVPADGDAPSIRAAAKAWRARHDAKHVLVVVDSLHTWAARASHPLATEYESINAALADLLALALALTAPVLVVAERPRSAMKDAGQSAAKGSARIEYAADSVLSLNRYEGDSKQDNWTHDAAGEYRVYAKLAKNRNGRTGHKVAMHFNGALASLREDKDKRCSSPTA